MPVNQLGAKSTLRLKFFELLFEDQVGWLCVATTHPDIPRASFKQKFFEWPNQHNELENYILQVEAKYNVYFCVTLLSKPERQKQNCLPTKILWADFDNPTSESVDKLPPPIIVRSSPSKSQAYWRLSTKLSAWQAELYSKRIAYAFDADKSGWDSVQLLRVPFTFNRKYETSPEIVIERALEITAPPLLFEALPEAPSASADPIPLRDMPRQLELPDPEHVLYKYSTRLSRSGFGALYSQSPQEYDDWSRILWRLIHVCFEAGMTAEEVFSVVQGSECNKYQRDQRPVEHLWRDIIKAEEAQNKLVVLSGSFAPLLMPELVEEPASETFIDSYREWAEEATDAVPQFHNLCAATLLSAVVATSVRLETSYGQIVPNLWGLILGDSTLTRKTTSMRMVMDILNILDPELLLATDGSVEGLFTGLSTRPSRTSIFYKDEVSGFFDSIHKKDYLADMPETFCRLYDAPVRLPRRLRKETIVVENPVFIFFAGGVRDRVYETINEEWITSGFLPRFLVVSGDTDFGRLRRTGPANELGSAKRALIVDKVANLYEQYASDVIMSIGGQKMPMPPRIQAVLTSEAWSRYGDIEMEMIHVASESPIPGLALPTIDRLSRSLLKLSTILAASRQEPLNSQITVTLDDVLNSAWYIQDWGRFSLDLIQNAGKRQSEKVLDKILAAIDKNPGILRSTITQHYHLNRREADEIFATLEDRQLIRKEPRGRGYSFFIA